MIAVAERDGCFRGGKLSTYDAFTYDRVEVLHVPEHPVRVIKVGKERLAVSRRNRPCHVSIHDSTSLKCLQELRGGSYPFRQVYGLGLIPRGSGVSSDRVVVADCKQHAVVYNLDSGDEWMSLPGPPMCSGAVECVPKWDHEVFLGGGRAFSLRTSDAGIRRYCMTKGGVLLNELEGHCGSVLGFATDVPRSLLFSVSLDATVKLWSPQTSRDCVSSISLSSAGYSCATSDADLLFTGLSDGRVEVWDIRSSSTRLLCFTPNRTFIFGLVRVARSTYVSLASEVSWWRPNGKIMFSIPEVSYGTGLCCVGTPFDRFARGSEEVAEFADRSRLVVSILNSSLSRSDGILLLIRTTSVSVTMMAMIKE